MYFIFLFQDSKLDYQLSLQKYDIYIKQKENDELILNILSNTNSDLINSPVYYDLKEISIYLILLAGKSAVLSSQLKEIEEQKENLKKSLSQYSPLSKLGEIIYTVVNDMNILPNMYYI